MRIVIVGGGLTGMALARLLRGHDMEAVVLERARPRRPGRDRGGVHDGGRVRGVRVRDPSGRARHAGRSGGRVRRHPLRGTRDGPIPADLRLADGAHLSFMTDTVIAARSRWSTCQLRGRCKRPPRWAKMEREQIGRAHV